MRFQKTILIMLGLTGLAVFLVGCDTQPTTVDVEQVTSEEKTYVGSDRCKQCHLEHYDSWKMTQHSRMLQDVQKNRDALVVEIDPERIRRDLQKIEDKLEIPPEDVLIPEVNDIRYTIGSQWKQRYVIEKDDVLYIAPIQYNVHTDRWVNYHEDDWADRPWMLKCGGCHATGVNLEKRTLVEPGVACEACHGKGSWHAALPKTQVFDKRRTIVNPAKLTAGVAAQICGSCHNRGHATQYEGAGWPVGYEPGESLSRYYESTTYEAGDVKHVYANEFSKGHHQQYIDWVQSKHFVEGVTCVSCHYVHELGIPSTQFQTKQPGEQQCLKCHTMFNANQAHSIHSFGNCLGCHMPRIAKSAESGDIRSHVFKALLPADTLRDPRIPNSCQTCHKHEDDDLEELQRKFELLTVMPKPQGKVMQPVSWKSGESGQTEGTEQAAETDKAKKTEE
ncbi:MAG: hypothetical protein K9K79_11835 [Desulfohalobiaceae bacterium]|nr:hypothetical protein [Desulfohalobiaceae bacterium]